MAATGLNLITKIAIMIISGVFVAFNSYKRFLIFADDRQYEAEKIIEIIGVWSSVCFSLFWPFGVHIPKTPVSVTSYSGLWWQSSSILSLNWSAASSKAVRFWIFKISIKVKFDITDNGKVCETKDYITYTLLLLIEIILFICVYTFIQSAK